MSEPLEWWLDNYDIAYNSKQAFEEHSIRVWGVVKPSIHVIEYSAYESLIESLVLAKKQRDEFEVKLATAIKILEVVMDEGGLFRVAYPGLTEYVRAAMEKLK